MFSFQYLPFYLICLSSILGHEYYSGSCPQFLPIQQLDWARFKGVWSAAFKHASRSSCIKYEFQGDRSRKVTEEKLLPVLGRFGVPSAVTSMGLLTTSDPPSGAMMVSWNTGLLRQAMFSKMEYVVLATDYDNKALVCSCQDLDMGFTGVNRRSCDYLIRNVTVFPSTVPSEYVAILNKIDPDLALDMKRVRQDDCSDLQGLGLDVGLWVQAGKTSVMNSGLAYIASMFG